MFIFIWNKVNFPLTLEYPCTSLGVEYFFYLAFKNMFDLKSKISYKLSYRNQVNHVWILRNVTEFIRPKNVRALHKKWKFSLRISSVNEFPADLVTFTDEILNWKLHFLCSGGFYIVFDILWQLQSRNWDTVRNHLHQWQTTNWAINLYG